MSTPFHGHTSRLNSPPDMDKVPSDSLLRDRVYGREAGPASHHEAWAQEGCVRRLGAARLTTRHRLLSRGAASEKPPRGRDYSRS